MFSLWLYEITGNELFAGRLFRAGAAALLAVILVMVLMPWYIRLLRRLDASSDLTEFDENGMKPPPIMGGLLLVAIVEMVSLLFCRMNGYTISTLAIMASFSIVGAVDDIAKIRQKRLIRKGKAKAADYMDKTDGIPTKVRLILYFAFSVVVAVLAYKFIPDLRGRLTVPFIPVSTFQIFLPNWIFVGFIAFVITATANGANFTDGIDGLVSVPIVTSMVFIGIVGYVCGNAIFSSYLNVSYLPGVDELAPLAAGIAGCVLAYLWFNSPPAEIYMGDSGSVAFGAAIGIMFILVQAGLFLPIVCLIFIVEAASSLLQTSWFKLTRRVTGTPRRLFLRAPIHHHYQLKWANNQRFGGATTIKTKISWRMHLISIFSAILGMVIFFAVR
ncbi:phospho-N-acetylmuramoyl-pentapeptide-transferase [Myxococcota bacterium]|nr:phospho-N-acetylmuramoyl-pentapeptide-transferase [Myxococcota bacterium]